MTYDNLIGETFFIACGDKDLSATTSKVVDFIIRRINFKGSTCKLLVDICAGAGIVLNGAYFAYNSIGSNEYYKNIIISDACVPFGDLVLAYRDSDAKAPAFPDILCGLLK